MIDSPKESELIRLSTAEIEVTIDPTYGGDITSIVTRESGKEILFQSPWREAAEFSIRNPGNRLFYDSRSDWLQKYRGGWQVLCPVAGGGYGDPDSQTLFHGEASRATWQVQHVGPHELELLVDLITQPLRISKTIETSGSRVTVRDTVSNRGLQAVNFDFAHHIALGGDLLNEDCRLATGATQFVRDPASSATPDREEPMSLTAMDNDFGHIPGPPITAFEFGWFKEFSSLWAEVKTASGALSVRLEWNDSMPFAWLWKELSASQGWPWFGRARVLGIEPSNTPTSGPNRGVRTSLEPGESVDFEISLQIGS
jgi:hypothetical protein